MLKLVLLAYSRGLVTSRKIEAPCEHNVLFMAVNGDARPSYTHIAKFVRKLGPQIGTLFTQVLMTCDRLSLIGRAHVDDNDPSRKMRNAIDSATGRALYRRPIATRAMRARWAQARSTACRRGSKRALTQDAPSRFNAGEQTRLTRT